MVCAIVTEVHCNTLGGTFQGAGTTCNPLPCSPGGNHGACCVTSPSGAHFCIITTHAQCGNINGQFQGKGSTCAPSPCTPGDQDNSGYVDVDDLIGVVLAWGPCPKSQPCAADFDHSGAVDVDDLIIVILNWS
jgi:hypothetical protein